MWIRNLPVGYQSQRSFHDNLVFLWKSDNVYVMDNHLAAAWCWMQECDAETRYNFMHIDRHNDLGTNTPFDVYRYIKDYQHLSIDEYTGLSWTNDGNGIQVKAFLWDNYIAQCAYLFPKWFQDVAFSTRTPFLGRREREKLLGTEIYSLSATELLHYIDNDIHVDEDAEQLNESVGRPSLKWIVNLDLDYFFEKVDNHDNIQIMSDDYIRLLARKLRFVINRIQVLTIALSPECCGGWENALHALGVFMEAYEERPYSFPDDYQ